MEDTRVKLLQTAAKLFAKYGYAGTSIRQLSQEAEVNVSAVCYYFKDKEGLYLATLQHLVTSTFKEMGDLEDYIASKDTASEQDWLEGLHKLLDKLLDLNFARKNTLFERIVAHTELGGSDELLSLLHKYVSPFITTLHTMLAHLTNVKQNSTEMFLLTHSVFSQVHFTALHRFSLLESLQIKDFSPEVREEIKRLVWKNTLGILNSYKKGNNQ